MKRFFDLVSPRPGGDEVRDDDVERVVASGEEEEHDGGQGVEERQPVEDEEGGWSVWGDIGILGYCDVCSSKGISGASTKTLTLKHFLTLFRD